MGATQRVIDHFAKAHGFTTEEALVGGAAYDAEGAPVSDATIAKAEATGPRRVSCA